MNNTAFHGSEILRAVDTDIRRVYNRHTQAQKLWMPTELFPADFKARSLPPATKAMLVLNLLTEDGLPYFFGLLVKHLGDEHAIWDWIRMWVGEEDRHGQALKIYLHRVLTREQLIAVQHLQYNYLAQGFWPGWGGDPVKLLAYVVLQEQATKVSHLGIAKAAKDDDEVLFKIMKRIAAEEFKHHLAYFEMFKAALGRDVNHSLLAMYSVVRSFAMPGNGINGFQSLSEIQARSGVFGPAELAEIIEDVSGRLNLPSLTGLSAEGEKAREGIFASVKTLQRIAGRKRKIESFTLPGFGEDFVITL